MTDPQHVVAAGATAVAGWTLTGFIASAIPVLQFCSLLIGCLVGILTAVYTYRRIKAKKVD